MNPAVKKYLMVFILKQHWYIDEEGERERGGGGRGGYNGGNARPATTHNRS